MSVVVLKGKPKKNHIKKAREDHKNYIKITADLEKKIIAIGGEYHADAEKILAEKYGAKQRSIWGGGYNIDLDEFETIAVINIKQPNNPSSEIIDQKVRKEFLEFVKRELADIKSLL